MILTPNLSDVSINLSLVLKNGEEIYLYMLSSCHHLQLYHEYLAFVVQAVISCKPIFLQSFETMLILSFSLYRHCNHAHVRLV